MERVEQKKPTSSLLTTEGKNPEDSVQVTNTCMNPCEQNNKEDKDALEKIKKAQLSDHHIKEELAMSEREDVQTDLQNTDEEGSEKLHKKQEKKTKKNKKSRNWFVRLFTSTEDI